LSCLPKSITEAKMEGFSPGQLCRAAVMDAVQRKYKKKKSLYFRLIAAIFGIITAFRFVPDAGHGVTPIELFLLVCLIVSAIAMLVVFRCPQCNATLIPGFFSSWKRLRRCPKCGVKLTEK
jgi:hypothetical protein